MTYVADIDIQIERERRRRRAATAYAGELERCRGDVAYFLRTYVQIENITEQRWLPFDLWPAQVDTLTATADSDRVIVLKARQIGLTWLWLGVALHDLVFRSLSKVLLFSKRDDEAIDLLRRLTGMYDRLPDWMRGRSIVRNDHVWRLESGSEARSFPTTGGDSFTASLVIVDEADLVNDLGRLLRAVEPTMADGGRLVLISRVDKDKVGSDFQQIYMSAKDGRSTWRPIFLPWSARPGRTQEWYDRLRADIEARTGALDDLHEQYPATDAEALAPRSKDKRIAGAYLLACYAPMDSDEAAAAALGGIPGLRVYVRPQVGRAYVIGADPAEGNPTSDPSALTVLDLLSGEEVAALAGQFEPAVFGGYLATISRAYHTAPALIERNNHGHSVLLWLRQNAPGVTLLKGYDEKQGFLSNGPGKALLYNTAADAFRLQGTIVHSFSAYRQLASIEGRTLLAPSGEHDDEADGYALALVARVLAPRQARSSPTPALPVDMSRDSLWG